MNIKHVKGSQHLVGVSEMPALDHNPGKKDGQAYATERSEVLKWLVSQRGVLEWLFQKIRDRHLIVYDRDNEVWMGALTAQRLKEQREAEMQASTGVVEKEAA